MSSPERIDHPGALAELLLGHLRPYQELPPSLIGLVERAVVQTLDSMMLIEDPLTPVGDRPPANTHIPIPAMDVGPAIDAATAGIREEGLARHFHSMIALFGHVMLTLSGSEAQRAAVQSWVAQGLSGTFMMTDRGGPAMERWQSELRTGADGWRVRLDKIWAIGAAQCGFAIAVVRRPGAIAPTALLIAPQAYAQLDRTEVGLPYLDGTVRLGNCRGELACDAGWALSRGGLVAVKQFLTIVRPRFVMGLMAQLHWLDRQGRIALSDTEAECAACIDRLARSMAASGALTRHSEDEVMALKFVSNSLLLQIAQGRTVKAIMDSRDLLGFTKMEGSSYRCFYEIYMRARASRHG
jgi:hypothetical protein